MRTIIWLQKLCGIGGKLLGIDILGVFQKYKEAIFSCQKSHKTVLTTITSFHDMWIEELALSGNVEASAVRKQVKIGRTLTHKIDAFELC